MIYWLVLDIWPRWHHFKSNKKTRLQKLFRLPCSRKTIIVRAEIQPIGIIRRIRREGDATLQSRRVQCRAFRRFRRFRLKEKRRRRIKRQLTENPAEVGARFRPASSAARIRISQLAFRRPNSIGMRRFNQLIKTEKLNWWITRDATDPTGPTSTLPTASIPCSQQKLCNKQAIVIISDNRWRHQTGIIMASKFSKNIHLIHYIHYIIYILHILY